MVRTYDASGKIKDEEVASDIELIAKHFEGKMLVGAGTVLTEKQVELTKCDKIVSIDQRRKRIWAYMRKFRTTPL